MISEATFSRYYNQLYETDELETLINNLLDQCIDFDLLNTETMAIKALKLEAYERARPRSKIVKKNKKYSFSKIIIPDISINLN